MAEASTQQQLDQGPTTAELLRRALDDVRELARAEVELAGKELGQEARDALLAAVVTAACVALAVCAVALGVGALVVGFGGSMAAALGVAAAIVAVAGGVGFAVSVGKLPKGFLPRTRRRVASDISTMKDHLA